MALPYEPTVRAISFEILKLLFFLLFNQTLSRELSCEGEATENMGQFKNLTFLRIAEVPLLTAHPRLCRLQTHIFLPERLVSCSGEQRSRRSPYARPSRLFEVHCVTLFMRA